MGLKRIYVVGIASLTGVMTTLVVILLALVVFSWRFEPYFVLAKEAIEASQCRPLSKGVYCFFDENWDSSTYLAIISNFYTTIITVLIALIGIIGVFAFVVIRANAISHAEEVIEKQVTDAIDNGRLKDTVDAAIIKSVRELGMELKKRLDDAELQIEELGGSIGGKLEEPPEES